MPPTALVLCAVVSVQVGAAVAKSLFDDAGPAGTVLLRVAFAALVLWLLWRPRPAAHTRTDLRLAAAFGVTLAGMNLAFYEALDRIPLGIAVTLEFVGPLGVAVAASRRALDVAWVALAAGGHPAACRFGRRVGGRRRGGVGAAGRLLLGRLHPGQRASRARIRRWGRPCAGDGLRDVSAGAGGRRRRRRRVADPRVLAIGAAVAILSSAIPYSLELEALRRMPPGVFGVLMSLEPAVAAVAGLAILDEVLGLREWTGIALIVAASAGAARGARVSRPAEA